MSITKEQQQALDDALVPREQRLTIGSCNYRLSTTFKPKEPTFQVALDVLTLTPFYPALLITASVPAIYMQEFWAIVTYQKHHIRFKMNKKSYSFDMETFRNMLLICLKISGHKFVDPLFEEEILTFIRELGYPGNIKLLSDVKVDTLPQPWRTFGTIINKCLSGKVTGIDTLCLSRAQILWGLYHQEKVDYVYLLWEDLVFQIENKKSRKNKYMFYPRFTKFIINHFMPQDQSIPRRNKHEVVQRYGAILPDYLTNPTMKESEAYKTYHDLATGKVQPKPKYVRRSSRTKSDEAPKPSSRKRVKAMAKVAKSKTQLHISQPSGSGAHEGTGVTPGVPDVPTYEYDDEQISWKSSEEEDDDEDNVSEHDDDDDDERTESDNDDDDNSNEEVQGANTEEEEMVEEGRDTVMTDAPLPNVQGTQETEDTHVILTAPINREAVSSIPGIVDAYLANKMNEAVKTVVRLQSIKLKDEALAKNEAFLNSLDENKKKIIKDQVKQQVKAQVSKILPRIKKSVNEQLEAEVMTRSSTESKTSHVVAANLSELELKKILIDKMESNKSIYRSDEQKNLYKALVEAYENDKDKDEEPSAGSNRGSKRRRARKEPESTSAPKEKTFKITSKSTDGSKSQHKSAGESAHTEEPIHTNKDMEELAHQEFDIGATKEQSDEETFQHLDWFQKPAKIPTPGRDWNKTLPAVHGPVQRWLSNLAR
ncbi:hypothetical protein Tco_0987301, partial [Tanacetum coccineum]